MPHPPFTDVTATYVKQRSPEWKLHRSLGMGKKAISSFATFKRDNGEYYNTYSGPHELWLIKDTGGQLEWVNLWESPGSFSYDDLPWAFNKKWRG